MSTHPPPHVVVPRNTHTLGQPPFFFRVACCEPPGLFFGRCTVAVARLSSLSVFACLVVHAKWFGGGGGRLRRRFGLFGCSGWRVFSRSIHTEFNPPLLPTSPPPPVVAPAALFSFSRGPVSRVSRITHRFVPPISLDAEYGTVSTSAQPVLWKTDERNSICHCEGAVPWAAPPPASRRQARERSIFFSQLLSPQAVGGRKVVGLTACFFCVGEGGGIYCHDRRGGVKIAPQAGSASYSYLFCVNEP